MHVVAGQYTLDNLNTVFTANLPDDLSHAQPDVTLQNLVTIFGDPNKWNLNGRKVKALINMVRLGGEQLHLIKHYEINVLQNSTLAYWSVLL